MSQQPAPRVFSSTILRDPADQIAAAPPVAWAIEQPANAIRSIARLFTSDVEDKPWWYDLGRAGSGRETKGFWSRYLTELATQRFNRFSLTLGLGYNFPRRVSDVYLYFAYPFLV